MQFVYVAVQHASFEALYISSSLILITVVVTATEYVFGTGSSTNSSPTTSTAHSLQVVAATSRVQPTALCLPAAYHSSIASGTAHVAGGPVAVAQLLVLRCRLI